MQAGQGRKPSMKSSGAEDRVRQIFRRSNLFAVRCLPSGIKQVRPVDEARRLCQSSLRVSQELGACAFVCFRRLQPFFPERSSDSVSPTRLLGSRCSGMRMAHSKGRRVDGYNRPVVTELQSFSGAHVTKGFQALVVAREVALTEAVPPSRRHQGSPVSQSSFWRTVRCQLGQRSDADLKNLSTIFLCFKQR